MKKLLIMFLTLTVLASLLAVPSVSAEKEITIPNEGLFYIRNVATNKVLTASSSGVVQSNIVSSQNQLWIVKEEDVGENKYGTIYSLKTNSSSYPGYLSSGDEISTVGPLIYSATLGSIYWTCANLEVNNSSSQKIGIEAFALEVYPHSATNNSSVVIKSGSGDSDYAKWTFERLWYVCGDINMDGEVTTEDVTLLQNYNINAVSFSEAQAYLADANKDDNINGKDVLYIRKLIEGIDGVSWSY